MDVVELAAYLDFVGPDEIRLHGHRIGVEDIVEHYRNGYEPEEIAAEFPGLELEQVYGVLAYYLRHKAAMDEYVARQNERGEREYGAAVERPSVPMSRVRGLLRQRARSSA